LKELVDADQAASVLSVPGTRLTYSEDIAPEVIEQYPDRVEPLNARLSFWQKAARFGVFNRPMLWARHLDEYYRSEYYNDYVIAVVRGHHAIGLATPVTAVDDATGAPQTMLCRDRPQSAFGERELVLLRLVQPAYAAGVETCVRLVEQQAALARTLDTLAEGLLVCDGRGAIIHANAALDALLRAEPERGRLYLEVRRIAETLTGAGTPEGPLAGPLRSTITTMSANYRVQGNYLAEDTFHAGVAILVTVERTTPAMPAEADIQARFGLTRKEAAVTRLLAEGKANAAVAAALYISPHTARRHTESVMKKLGVASRAEVGPLLFRVYDVPARASK
jgi:DNA-binding CsgD family transcriptional regulator